MSTVTLSSIQRCYAGRRVTVMGLGHFGGGLGAAGFLAGQGAFVTITDRKSEDELAESLRELQGVPVERLVLGKHREEDFTAADLVVASPAVRPDHPLLQLARSRGAEVTTEIGLFWRHCPAKIIGVTGTVGKSTTAALIQHLIQATGRRVWLGGNIGGSLLPCVAEIAPDDWVVLELSSFQLMYLDVEARAPQIGVVTNFSPNHLDWHFSLDEYRHAKQAVLRHQQQTEFAVLPAWDADALCWPVMGKRRVVSPDDKLSESLELAGLPGEHNCRNASLAVAAAEAAGVEREQCLASLASFQGLPHRLEYIGEFAGRLFYNDSKATTPESAIAALNAFKAPLIVLAGGSDKQVDLRPFARELALRAKAISLMGETAAQLDRHLCAEDNPIPPPRSIAGDFAAAFRWAMEQSSPGDIILLSPGCASFGWFRDYADRGAQFRRMVEGLGR